jgi:hypothetical protein
MRTKYAVSLVLAAAAASTPAQVLTFTQISTPFNSPIGIDYHEPTNSVVMSVNYAGGVPNNFVRVNLDGTQTGFSTISGLTEEVKIATVRSGNAGFAAGTLFTGNGLDGQIVRINPDGGSFLNPWVTLAPGAGLMRGSLYVDRTGVFGGDLIAATTGGEVWRINSAGASTRLADVNTHLEGLITVPNEARYGGLAGKIIAGAEEQGRLYVFDGTVGNSSFYQLTVAIEDIDLIPANENFFGVNFGTGRLLGAAASQFAAFAGDILLTQEFPTGGAGLYRLTWDSATNLPVTQLFTLGAGSAAVAQWEHVTFAPAGIVEIPPVPGIPEPETYALMLLGLGAIGALARRRRAR